jgi:hypothetical protein
MEVVPKLWPGGTLACVATGPSLTQTDVDYVRDKVDAVIVVNNAFKLAPWAAALMVCDAKFYAWHWKHGLSDFKGLKYSLDTRAKRFRGVKVLCNTGDSGLELDPTGLRTGKNSGFQSVGLAVHFGAAKIVLLGFDFRLGPKGQKHCHADHPDKSAPPFALCLRLFHTIVEPLRALGVTVVNCSPHSSLTAFPQQPIREALR